LSKPRGKETRQSYYYVLLFLSLGLFLVLALERIHQPVALDDLYWLVAAKSYLTTGVPKLYHFPDRVHATSPHLFMQSVVLAVKLFGASDATARLPGVLSIAISILLVFFIIKSLSRGDRSQRLKWAALGSILYASTPTTVQGSLILEPDVTVLIPALLLLFLSFVKYQQKEKTPWAFVIGLATALSLGARVTTTPVFLFILLLYLFLGRSSQKAKQATVIAIVGGALFFLAAWYAYCAAEGLPFKQPFTYALEAFLFRTKRSVLSPHSLVQSLLFLFLWTGIFPLFLLLTVGKRRVSDFLADKLISMEDVLLVAAGLILVGYTLAGGVKFGYPTYHTPGMPLAYAFICIALSGSKDPLSGQGLTRLLAIALAAFAIQAFLAGDLIFTLRHALRESLAIASPPPRQVFNQLALNGGLILGAYALLFILAKKLSAAKPLVGLLILLSIGSTIGTSFAQAAQDYYIGYNHGGQGTKEAAQYVLSRVPLHSTVVMPSEIVYYLDMPNVKYTTSSFWLDMGALITSLADKKNAAFAYGIPTNTIQQIKTIRRNRDIQKLLREEYDEARVGSFTVWIRKEYQMDDIDNKTPEPMEPPPMGHRR
jgi:4-amino-4-deoxy-L-arabinose transferase-like glycosyltransferase